MIIKIDWYNFFDDHVFFGYKRVTYTGTDPGSAHNQESQWVKLSIIPSGCPWHGCYTLTRIQNAIYKS